MPRKDNAAEPDSSLAVELEAALRRVLGEYDKLAQEYRALREEMKKQGMQELLPAPMTQGASATSAH